MYSHLSPQNKKLLISFKNNCMELAHKEGVKSVIPIDLSLPIKTERN